MTTIVYANGTLAADTRLTLGSQVVQQHAKKISLPENCTYNNELIEAIGVAGSFAEQEAFTKWLQDGANPKEPVCGISAIILGEKRTWVFYAGAPGRAIEVETTHSIGSGGSFANASLVNSNDAAKAVATAIKLDIYSGGNITVYNRGSKVIKTMEASEFK